MDWQRAYQPYTHPPHADGQPYLWQWQQPPSYDHRQYDLSLPAQPYHPPNTWPHTNSSSFWYPPHQRQQTKYQQYDQFEHHQPTAEHGQPLSTGFDFRVNNIGWPPQPHALRDQSHQINTKLDHQLDAFTMIESHPDKIDRRADSLRPPSSADDLEWQRLLQPDSQHSYANHQPNISLPPTPWKPGSTPNSELPISAAPRLYQPVTTPLSASKPHPKVVFPSSMKQEWETNLHNCEENGLIDEDMAFLPQVLGYQPTASNDKHHEEKPTKEFLLSLDLFHLEPIKSLGNGKSVRVFTSR